jgi:hypothetical protein
MMSKLRSIQPMARLRWPVALSERIDRLIDVQRAPGAGRQVGQDAFDARLPLGLATWPQVAMAPALIIGLNGAPVTRFQADGIEGLARGLDTDAFQHAGLALVFQRQAVGQRLGDRLDGEGLARVADLVDMARRGGDADAEPVRVRPWPARGCSRRPGPGGSPGGARTGCEGRSRSGRGCLWRDAGQRPWGAVAHHGHGFLKVLAHVALDLGGDGVAPLGRHAGGQQHGHAVHEHAHRLFGQRARQRLDGGLLQPHDAGGQLFLGGRGGQRRSRGGGRGGRGGLGLGGGGSGQQGEREQEFLGHGQS